MRTQQAVSKAREIVKKADPFFVEMGIHHFISECRYCLLTTCTGTCKEDSLSYDSLSANFCLCSNDNVCHFLFKGKAHLFEVLDTLYHELTACEILQSQPLEKAQSRQSLSNPLVISCWAAVPATATRPAEQQLSFIQRWDEWIRFVKFKVAQ